MTMLDLRRTDERDHVWYNPFWVSSGELSPDADDLEAVFFSFPTVRGAQTLLYDAVFEVLQVFNGTPDTLIGIGTIPLETSTTGATVSVVDADEIFQTADIDLTSAGWTYLSGGDMLTALAAGGPGVIITNADATVPVVYATLTATGTITTGRGRLHLLMSILPPQ